MFSQLEWLPTSTQRPWRHSTPNAVLPLGYRAEAIREAVRVLASTKPVHQPRAKSRKPR